MYAPIVATPGTLELVEDTIVLVQIAEFPPQMIMYRDRLDRSRLHVDIPDLEVEVVPREDVPPIATELDVRDRRDDLREE